MNFELSDDQRLLVDTARSYAKKSSPPERVRELRDADGWDRSAWRGMAELGWPGLVHQEDVGGFGGSVLDMALVVEQLAQTLTPEPLVEVAVLAGLALAGAGTKDQAKRWLEPLIEGECVLALAHGEGRGPTAVETQAEVAGSGYRLRGSKRWVPAGRGADGYLVSAVVGGELGLFHVPAAAPHLKVQSLRTIGGRGSCHLELDGVEVTADDRMAGGEIGLALHQALDAACVCSIWEGLGIAQASLAMTLEYLKTREQFGVKIGSFQALAHRAVDMFVEVELVRSLAIAAAVAMDDAPGPERDRMISAAKLQLARGGNFVTRQAIQLHGGIGVTDEHNIGLYFKRMQAITAQFGGPHFHRDRFSSLPTFEPGNFR